MGPRPAPGFDGTSKFSGSNGLPFGLPPALSIAAALEGRALSAIARGAQIAHRASSHPFAFPHSRRARLQNLSARHVNLGARHVGKSLGASHEPASLPYLKICVA